MLRHISIFFLTFVFALPVYAASPALKTIDIIAQANMNRDADTVEKHLDMDAILTDFFTSTLPAIKKEVEAGVIILPPELESIILGLDSSNAVGKKLAILLLAAETQKFVRYGVTGGLFCGQPISDEELAKLECGIFCSFGRISTARKDLQNSYVLSETRTAAVVATHLYDDANRKTYYLELKLENLNGIWLVRGLNNGPQLLETLLQEIK